MPPATHGNLLFKLHLFLSKLCQTRNLFYYIYTYVFGPIIHLPHPSHRLYFPFQPQTSFTHPLLYSRLFYLFLPFNAKHGHIKSTSTVSNCDLYFMPFCFQHDETSQRLNWPERDDQRLSSRKATVASSVSQPFS